MATMLRIRPYPSYLLWRGGA